MMPLAGYADRLSLRPGECIRFHVADASGAEVAARIVRVVSADPNPAGPGVRLEPVSAGIETLERPGKQAVVQGSFARIPVGDVLTNLRSFTVVATVQPTLLAGRERAVLSAFAPRRGSGFGLSLRADATVCARVIARNGEVVSTATPRPISERAWARIWMSYDEASTVLLVGQQPLASGRPQGPSHIASSAPGGCTPFAVSEILIAACQATDRAAYFNGRIERPLIFNRALTEAEIARAAAGAPVDGLVAGWDFSREIGSDRIVDIGPHDLDGTLVNSPARAMRGASWTGREQCFRHAPEQYGAIHFHDDDIDDCRWPATFAWTVPAGTRSGAFALMLEAGEARENVPFFVVPPKGIVSAKIAVLMSTFTYTVYHNHARPEWATDPGWRSSWLDQAKAWDAYRHHPGDHREYGLSTYNNHSDGSGIHFASWHRPMLNVRVGFVTYPGPEIRGSGLRHFPADTHLLSWLETKGYDYDLITDWELHHEGRELLKRYPVVMTGSHPEYHTGEMLDALEAYRDGGGRLMYLGGNGFYWKIALSTAKPGLIEIRRAEGGIRAWAAEPGEYYNQLDGEYGGLWRRNGRPPQQLVGVGFTAQGNFVGSHYRIRSEAREDPRTAWIFAGVNGDVIGDFGLSGHGAAGFELDRADKRLGTPAHAIVLASSENHPPEAPWVLVPEEQLTHLVTLPGEPAKSLIRADLTFFETPGDGAVFSTGSITFCGSLPHTRYDNSVSRLLANVLDRFLDPDAGFPLPSPR